VTHLLESQPGTFSGRVSTITYGKSKPLILQRRENLLKVLIYEYTYIAQSYQALATTAEMIA